MSSNKDDDEFDGWGDLSDVKTELLLDKLWPMKEKIDSIIQSSGVAFPRWIDGSRVDLYMRCIERKLSEIAIHPVVSVAFRLMLQVHHIKQLSKYPTPIEFYMQNSYFKQFNKKLLPQLIEACECIINAVLKVADYEKIVNFFKLTYNENEIVKNTYDEIGISSSERLIDTNPIVKINIAILADRMTYIDILEPYLQDMEYVLKRENLKKCVSELSVHPRKTVSCALENDHLWQNHVFNYRPDLAPILSWVILITRKLHGEQRDLFYRLMARELNKASCNNLQFVTLTASRVYGMVVQETGPLIFDENDNN